MSKRILIADIKDDEEDRDLRNLLEKYIRRSEELEQRESKVIKQIELMQSAVTSLQSWNQSRKASAVSSVSVHLDPKEVEEETKLIQQETERIQEEIRLKMEENKKLEAEVNRRKGLHSGTDDLPLKGQDRLTEKTDTEVREKTESGSPRLETHSGIQFFDDKLRKLRETERKLKKESGLQSEESRKKYKNLEQKLEMLEWESQMEKQLLSSLKKKTEKK